MRSPAAVSSGTSSVRSQSNKTRAIAGHYDWVHSIDRERIALRLSEQRPPALPPLNVCIQVRLGDGPERAGVDPAAVAALAERIRDYPDCACAG
jgi:PLP dependent protein